MIGRSRTAAIGPGQSEAAPDVGGVSHDLLSAGVGMMGHGEHADQFAGLRREVADLELPVGQRPAVPADRAVDLPRHGGKPPPRLPGM